MTADAQGLIGCGYSWPHTVMTTSARGSWKCTECGAEGAMTGPTPEPPMSEYHLTRYATLVVGELNMLWAQECCATCCAPCTVIRDLLDDGHLDDVVRQAPEHLWTGAEWWVNDSVDRAWLTSRWACMSKPQCDEAEPADVYLTMAQQAAREAQQQAGEAR